MTEGTETAGAEAPVIEATPVAETPEAPVTETATEETAETVQKTESAETEDRPKRESGYARMKRRALLAEAQLANARLKEATGTKAEGNDKEDKAPREEDFNGDWGKYIAATAAYEAAKAVKGTLADDKRSAYENRAAELNREVLTEFEERIEEFKSRATDFDDVVSGYVASGGQFSDAVRELVMDSDVGPQLTYHLAKNPVLAKKINGLTPLQAAKEIARIEDSLTQPSSKATKAPPPIRPPSGGASAPVDVAALAKRDDATDLIRHWRAKAAN